MSYYIIEGENGKSFSLSLPANHPLVFAPSNVLDKIQHFSLEPAGDGSFFIVSRPRGQVFDVTSSKYVEGNPVSVYNKKSSDNNNQRFRFTSPGFISVIGSSGLHVVAAHDTKVMLSAKGQVFTLREIPPFHTITIDNAKATAITITYDNAPASEAPKTWTVDPKAKLSIPLFAGATISVRDVNGKVLPPTPHLVTKPETLSFQDEPQAKLIYFAEPGQKGESIEYLDDEPNLANRPTWQDRPRSFRVIAGNWIIYQDFYTGNKIVVNPRGGKNLDGNYDETIWGGYPSTVVGITSHRLLPEDGLALFDYEEFQSTASGLIRVNDNVQDITSLGFANKVTSLVVVSGIWELWDRVDFQGARRIVTVDGGRDGTGWYNLAAQWGTRPATIMSIRKYVPNSPPFPAHTHNPLHNQ